ncbi:MAG: GDP-L-fucose synthase [Bryobacteraceae bacterium]
MEQNSRIYVAGHRGLVGAAILRRLAGDGYRNLITRPRRDLDLTDRDAVERFFGAERPEYVFLAAAKVGGIMANNTQPADFIRENLFIQANVIDASYRHGVKKLVVLGSSCIYPKLAPQPIREEYLLGGPLEPTNRAYAVAKIAGIVMAQSYREQFGLNAINLMPTNLYGPGDNFDLQTSHVLPALIRKFHDAKTRREAAVTLWGSGSPRREFLHVDDFADATLFLMLNYEDDQIINVGTGEDITIADLGRLVAEVVGFEGRILFDATKPDGTPRKQLDVTRLTELGWKPSRTLRDGIADTYEWYVREVSPEGRSFAFGGR